ncbi:lysozyme [Haloechinothrix salitolerans]|uniref:Lysozyme n=1 Tax=Haloechinothrix salitolerans TaxID=926830 RepID=A0ABW2BTL0_9PSEU
MTATRGRPGRRVMLGALAVVGAVVASLLSTPSVSAEPLSAVDVYVHRFSHPMGSQIAAHERGGPRQESPGDSETSDGSGAESDGIEGIDVSGWQREVDWQYWWDKGKRFAYVKATEGTGYRNPYFTQQYVGSYDVGMIRGAYHFALPDRSSGAAQARYFAERGGAWSADGQTLPGALDLEYNPYGETCYGKSKRAMRAWITDFHDTYREHTGRAPVIYTSANWWNQCVGDGHGFEETVPLWVARYADKVGDLPAGWDFHTFWQYSNDPIDQNTFNGTRKQLEAVALGE